MTKMDAKIARRLKMRKNECGVMWMELERRVFTRFCKNRQASIPSPGVAITIARDFRNVRVKGVLAKDSLLAKPVPLQQSRGSFILEVAHRPDAEHRRLRECPGHDSIDR